MKGRKSTYQADEILAIFYKLVALILICSTIKKSQNIANVIVEANSTI